jgi:hypothetical protein
MSIRRLPRKQTTKHKLIIQAVDDFLGEGYPTAQRKLKKDIALWLMGRKKGVKLNEEQKEAVWYIRKNLSDPTYRQNLL